MEESLVYRSDVLPDLVTTPDPFEYDRENVQNKHVIDIIREFGGGEKVPLILTQIISEELRKYGVDYEVSTRSSRSKTRKSPRMSKEPSNGLHRLVEVRLRSSDTKVYVPFIIRETCDFIRQHIMDEGILRKSGSSSRAACIMQRFLSPETEEYFSTFDTVHDVANVLKQYLREMEVPLIPHSIHHVFIQCLEQKSLQTECIILATCLIPPQTIGILTFVMEFLTDVAQASGDNLMTYENLAIVMGPNIMPVDQRRHEKVKDFQQAERHVLDIHNKVVEAMIVHADSIGRVSFDVEKRLEAFISLRSSEDELENDGVGRRKKRRSGSLNRMLGFLKKVTSGKGGGETPIVPSTPCNDSFSHTPVIKGSSRKRTIEDNLFSLHKKKNLLDGVRKYGDVKIDASGTPNTLAALIAFPSPAVCLNPSPMRVDYKQTPNGNRLKNFVTPSLLRRRDKMAETEKTVFSAPAKPCKPKLRFGRKGGKKQDGSIGNETKTGLQKGSTHSSSTISIHKLTNSPRATVQRNASTRIPRPDKPGASLRKETSSISLSAGNTPTSDGLVTPDGIDSSGDYVLLSANAEANDVKNEAFIASSISLTDSEYEPLQSRKIHRTRSSVMLTDDSVLQHNKIEDMDESSETTLDFPDANKLQLTPLIREIDTLTRTAQDLTLSTLKGKSASSLRSVRSRTLPESPTELDTTPLNVEQVENKFIRALKETKIVQIRSENPNTTRTPTNIHRRLSVQDRGMSPSQRRILSSARRRSHEIGRVTPVVNSAQFMSLRSPRAQPPVLQYSCSTLKRSPNRCTLKRGRPNTTRVGLARPSPVRSTPRSGLNNHNRSRCESINNKSQEAQHDIGILTTPLRRMSSVQELVFKLEKNRKNKSSGSSIPTEDQLDDQSRNCSHSVTLPPLPDVVMTDEREHFEPIRTRSMSRQAEIVSTAASSADTSNDVEKQTITSTNDDEVNWIAAHKFGFDRKDLRSIQNNSDRDSIHFLKTLHAGKVPATVEYFNKIGKPGTKSPGKSLIPRYTALHRSESTRSNTRSTVTTPDQIHNHANAGPSTNSTDRLSRRLSAVDIRQRHEQLLQNIKNERSAVKRSATTAGSYPFSKRIPIQTRSLNKPEVLIGSSTQKRPTTLELRKTPSPSSITSRRMSFRKTPTARTPRIDEEDESLTASVQKAIDTLLGPSVQRRSSDKKFLKPSTTALTLSPLKSSNIANIHRQLSLRNGPNDKVSPTQRAHVLQSNVKTNGNMVRTISERGTKATMTSSPRVTPKVKKALTTRAYDMINTPRNQAHNCPTITPRRRLPPRLAANSENRNQTPLKATHKFTPTQGSD